MRIAPGPEHGHGEHSFPQWLSAVDRQITLALQQHDLDAARAWYEALQRTIEQRRHAPGELLSALTVARLSNERRQGDRAEHQVRNVILRAHETGNVLVLLRAERLLAAILRGRGEVRLALEIGRESSARATSARLPYEALLGWLEMAESAIALAGTQTEAEGLLERCLESSAVLGAVAAHRRAELFFQRLRSSRREWPAGLTDREIDVLRLLATGLADRAIAERLFISTRTVTTHVGNLLGKTESANRTELAMWAVQHGLVTAEGSIEYR